MFHLFNSCGAGFGGLFWIGLIGLVIWLIVKNNNERTFIPPNIGETPLDILKRRYAKGEISQEDFERMKKDLEK